MGGRGVSQFENLWEYVCECAASMRTYESEDSPKDILHNEQRLEKKMSHWQGDKAAVEKHKNHDDNYCSVKPLRVIMM